MHLPNFTLPSGGLRSGARAPLRLRALTDFGSNPGALGAWQFTPVRDADELLPLVVVLHGCTQTAAGYDSGSGWSQLAEAFGFAVLFPEQSRTNNGNLCFNWFEPADTRRGSGEAASIAQMIATMVTREGIDPARVFITGLSAGGAMTSVMLAVYPELFAGGAILAGLPHGAAAGVQQALQQMRTPSRGKSIRAGSTHSGAWPTVSIWHGTADSVVNPSNADAIVEQWKDVHGAGELQPEDKQVDGHPYRAWRDRDGSVRIEEYRVTGMGHGTPLATGGECGCGQAGAFMLEVGISSTVHSARTWGLLGKRRTVSTDTDRVAQQAEPSPGSSVSPTDGISQVIEDALRAAGLMK